MKTTKVGPFPKGINNVADEYRMPNGSLRSALNVDLDDTGWPNRRVGQTLLYSGTNIHSLYKRFFMENGEFKYLEPDNTATVKKNGLNINALLTYTEVNNEIYISNGLENFKTTGEWGIETPAGQPSLSAISGTMKEGTYQITTCFINSQTGELSGSSLGVVITIGNNQGIALSNLPQSNKGFDTVIYMTNRNGEGFYFQVVVLNGTTDHNIYSQFPGKPLETQFLEKAPAGQIIRYYRGRIYIAADNILWYTEPHQYGLYKPSMNFIPFPERITILEPATNGIFVCSDGTYFLSGQDPNEFNLTKVSSNTGKEGTGLEVDAGDLALEKVSGPIPIWWSSKGLTIGYTDGHVDNIIEDQLSTDEILSGSVMYREIDGIRQLLTTLKKGGEESSFAATDYASATVIRNGVVI